MAIQPRCAYCGKILNAEGMIGAVISVNGKFGQDKNFKPEIETKRWITNGTREVKVCKVCVIYAELRIMPMSRKEVIKHTGW